MNHQFIECVSHYFFHVLRKLSTIFPAVSRKDFVLNLASLVRERMPAWLLFKFKMYTYWLMISIMKYCHGGNLIEIWSRIYFYFGMSACGYSHGLKLVLTLKKIHLLLFFFSSPMVI